MTDNIGWPSVVLRSGVSVFRMLRVKAQLLTGGGSGFLTIGVITPIALNHLEGLIKDLVAEFYGVATPFK